MKSVTTRTLLTLILIAASAASAVEKEPPRNQAAKDEYKDASVHLGEDGKLVYTPDERGNKIPDFSRCGYMGGGVKLPDVPVKITLEPREGMPKELETYDPENPVLLDAADDAPRIQKAIDEVSAMPLDENGFRGAVLLKRGVYRTTTTLWIKASGVVLRGEGQAKDGSVILCAVSRPSAVIEIYGKRILTEIPNSRREIADKYVPWGVTSFNLKSTKGLAVGDTVVVFRPNTYEWLDVMGMRKKGWGKEKPVNEWGMCFDFMHMRFERNITAIEGNRITLDAPTVQAMDEKFGGGFVYKFTEEGAISQSGVEHLRTIGAVPSPASAPVKYTTLKSGVRFTGCVNCWARNLSLLRVDGCPFEVGSKHHMYADVGRMGTCKFITIQDCAALRGHSVFIIRRAQFCLIQRCMSYRGHHCNSSGARVQGPNVYLDMVNVQGFDAGPHHNYAMGLLYDNVLAKKMIAYHGRPHGWRGAQTVFWNAMPLIGTVITQLPKVDGLPVGRNYFFSTAQHKGREQLRGSAYEPRSLYLKQLEERLGKEAVKNVTTEAQRKASIDRKSELHRYTFLWEPIMYGIGEQTRKEAKK